MFSYWEQQSFANYDHIVAGAGIVGLSTALELRKLYPKQRILVLERGLLPTGASTRNAGFACMGSATELLDDLEYVSENEAVRLFEMRKNGLEQLRANVGDVAIGYRERGSYELISSKELYALDKIPYLNELLRPVLGKDAYRIANEHVAERGFSASYVKALIENTCEGELHTGMLIRALTDLAISAGIEIKTGAEVIEYAEEGNRVEVHVKDPFRKEIWPLTCSTFTICTNAFTRQLLPDVDVTPGRGQVVVTSPIAGLKFKGIYHFDKGYYYFREIDGRVLLGGGRNLDFAGEETTEIALSEVIQTALMQKLTDVILPGVDFSIDYRWAGIMAFGPTKTPIVKAFSDRVYGGFRMGGMGVALGSLTAMQIADLHKERMK